MICRKERDSSALTPHLSQLPCFTRVLSHLATLQPVCKLIVGHRVCLPPHQQQRFIFFHRKKLLLLTTSICRILKPSTFSALCHSTGFCCALTVSLELWGALVQQTPSAELQPALGWECRNTGTTVLLSYFLKTQITTLWFTQSSGRSVVVLLGL